MSCMEIADLQTNLFEELSDADLMAVVGGAGTVSSTAEGLTSAAGQTIGIALQGVLDAGTAANGSLDGYLGNTTKPTLDQVPA